MLIRFEICSSCYGVVEEVRKRERTMVYEQEVLCLVKKPDGSSLEVPVSFSGRLASVAVKQGDRVIPDMVLAHIEEEIGKIGMGSD